MDDETRKKINKFEDAFAFAVTENLGSIHPSDIKHYYGDTKVSDMILDALEY